MNLIRKKPIMLTGVFLAVILLFSACSEKEPPIYSIINPVEYISVTASSIPNSTNPNEKPKETLNNKPIIIAIDAGHQSKGNSKKEPIGPGAKETKQKVSSGTRGVKSGVAEYKLNLIIAQMVKEELTDRGYEVFMIRETNNVNLSNKERAEMANKSGAELFIHIHADSYFDPDIHGVSTLYPSPDNPYVSKLSNKSLTLSKVILKNICKSTDAYNRGTMPRDDMSGINWCKIPVTTIEMGFMSNPKEDKMMQTKAYQKKIVNGICNGIDSYYDDAEDE